MHRKRRCRQRLQKSYIWLFTEDDIGVPEIKKDLHSFRLGFGMHSESKKRVMDVAIRYINRAPIAMTIGRESRWLHAFYVSLRLFATQYRTESIFRYTERGE